MSIRFRRHVLCYASLCALALAAPAGAAEQTAMRKAGRGLAALTTGFLEIPGSVKTMTEKRGAAAGLTLGFAEGVGKMVPRYVVGAFELVTCPLEAPAGFKPILEPEFPWGHFEE